MQCVFRFLLIVLQELANNVNKNVKLEKCYLIKLTCIRYDSILRM